MDKAYYHRKMIKAFDHRKMSKAYICLSCEMDKAFACLVRWAKPLIIVRWAKPISVYLVRWTKPLIIVRWPKC